MWQKMCIYKVKKQSVPYWVRHRVLTSGETAAGLVAGDSEDEF